MIKTFDFVAEEQNNPTNLGCILIEKPLILWGKKNNPTILTCILKNDAVANVYVEEF